MLCRILHKWRAVRVAGGSHPPVAGAFFPHVALDKPSTFIHTYVVGTQAEYHRQYAERNREAIAARKKAWRQASKVARLTYNATWKAANTEKVLAQRRRRAATPHGRESIKYTRVAYRAEDERARVSWADRKEIAKFYALARALTEGSSNGIEWVVDHIVPLKSPLVCGLHVENNLQVIPASENIHKGNRMDTFQQPKIIGYRELTEAEASLVNQIKKHGMDLELLIIKLRANHALDQRWVNIGATDLQTGLMALVRAVTQPTTF